ncbi:MAG: MEKHLA domain-containing protein, partial [Planctomycetia bacterium]
EAIEFTGEANDEGYSTFVDTADDEMAEHGEVTTTADVVSYEAASQEPWKTAAWLEQTQIILNSWRRHLGDELIERSEDPEEEARRLFEAPFVVVSHGAQADPILNYGNQMALNLWEMDIPTLTSTPSRLTAEPMHRDERAAMMERAARNGFVDDYRGVRISSTGQRFQIDRAIIWNLHNSSGYRVGQAATFSEWTELPADVSAELGSPEKNEAEDKS